MALAKPALCNVPNEGHDRETIADAREMALAKPALWNVPTEGHEWETIVDA